ncbi:Fatty acid synthase [Araneus ventricosus]|uniref:Fatty acid synthase n=1 Tax=Araneus ventricosus TaxID=182803 RepID=A0A4Y2GLW5_ARAVE|nr:Fatty acid synthase [Araneus ventricosus]
MAAPARSEIPNRFNVLATVENFITTDVTVGKIPLSTTSDLWRVGMKFFVKLLDSSGRFEISEGNSVVASGRIYESKNMTFQECLPEYHSDVQSISGKEIYEQLKRLGYEYGPSFQSILEVNSEGTSGIVEWKEKWIPFLDALLLFFGLNKIEDQLLLPTGISLFKIDPNALKSALHSDDISDKKEQTAFEGLPVVYNKETRICRSVGVEIADMTTVPVPSRQKNESPILEECKFFPYDSVQDMSQDSSQKISKYFRACNLVMDEIGKTLRKDVKKYQFIVERIHANDLEEFSEEEIAENNQLLKSLKLELDASNISESMKNDTFTTYLQLIGTDILNNALANEDTIRILLDIIFENTFRRLSVIEICNVFPVISTIVSEIVDIYNYKPFKRSILLAHESVQVNDEVLKKHKIEVLSGDKLSYMMKDQEESKQDIAISSFMCGSLYELKELLHTLTSVIRKSGFIILFFKEKLNHGELFLSSLCGREFQTQTQPTLEKALRDENLLILSKISDSLGCSVYLLRFPCLSEPQKILLTEDNDYEWVQKIKQELFEKYSGTIWLVSEKTRMSGIVGMVKCLLKEPGGERIR